MRTDQSSRVHTDSLRRHTIREHNDSSHTCLQSKFPNNYTHCHRGKFHLIDRGCFAARISTKQLEKIMLICKCWNNLSSTCNELTKEERWNIRFYVAKRRSSIKILNSSLILFLELKNIEWQIKKTTTEKTLIKILNELWAVELNKLAWCKKNEIYMKEMVQVPIKSVIWTYRALRMLTLITGVMLISCKNKKTP